MSRPWSTLKERICFVFCCSNSNFLIKVSVSEHLQQTNSIDSGSCIANDQVSDCVEKYEIITWKEFKVHLLPEKLHESIAYAQTNPDKLVNRWRTDRSQIRNGENFEMSATANYVGWCHKSRVSPPCMNIRTLVNVLFVFFFFYPPTDRFEGYSDQHGICPSVDASLCPPKLWYP